MRIDGPQITGSLNLNGDAVGDLESLVTTSSLNTYTSSVDTTMGHVMTATHSLNTYTGSANNRFNTIEGVTGSYATTGSNLFKGTQTLSGSIIPAVDNTYDLGSTTHQFRDLYLSSASLYIDGTKVLSSTTQELQITTDTGQSFKILEAGSDTITLQSNDGNITLATSGGGDVILDPTTGIIALKGTTQVYAGNKVRSSDGNNIVFGDGMTVSGSITVTGYIETQELRTTYISSSILYRSGSTKFGDELGDTHSFTGSLSVSGSATTVGAATFTSTGVFGNASLNGAYLVVKGTNGIPASSGTTTTAVLRISSGTGLYNVLDFGTNESLDYSWIQSTRANSLGTYDYLAVQPNGGNLVVGSTINSGYRLDVNGTGRFTNDLRVGQATASTNVQFILNGVANKAQRILFQNSGTDQWLLGAGSASETSAFELYNATGTIVLSVNKTTNASTFSNTLQANGKIFLQRASTGADTLLQFKNEVGVDKAYIKFGGVDEELAFYAGAGGTRNLIIGPTGEMAFNTSTAGVRSYLFKALSGRQLAIEALESGGVHSIYLRPSSSGRNLITSNYFSGGAYLPLALSGRENDVDLVLHTNGNISAGSATDGGAKLVITGANSVEGQLYVGNTNVEYSAGINFTTSGANRGFVGWRHNLSGAPFSLTGIHLFNTDNSNIVFGTNNTIKAVINVDGNLGINDNNPLTRLSVNGANYVEMATFACTTAGSTTLVADNSGYVQFSNGNARHVSNTSVFTPVIDGIRILKAGMVHVTVSQDIITAGTTGYVGMYIQKNKATFSENLITNTNGEWDGMVGVGTIAVSVNDVINFYYSASNIVSFDPNTWSQYSFIWTSR